MVGREELSMTRLMTLQEVAAYLRVTEQTVHRLLREGNIPSSKIGHQWRFDKTLVDEWVHHQGSSKPSIKILVVDDEEIVGSLFKDTLESHGYVVAAVTAGSQGLELVKAEDFSLVFLDLKMPGMDGATLFREIRAVKPYLPVVIITGFPESDLMARALSVGPFGVMSKPFTSTDLLTAVNSYLRFGTLTSHF